MIDFKKIDLKKVKEVAEKLGCKVLITNELNMPMSTFEFLVYRNYTIVNKEYRDFAIKFAAAVQHGIYLHKTTKYIKD